MSANSMPSVYCVTSVTSGFLSVQKITCKPCKSGCSIAQLVKNSRVNRLRPQPSWRVPQVPGQSYAFFQYLHLALSMSRPLIDDEPSRPAGPSEFNPLHAGAILQDTSPSLPKSGGIPGSPSPSFKDLTPTNFPPAHESRRRNAEQRAATLRGDALVGEVEPNRVFCTLCKKWVQLRQDSSYCAYPWLQHRGKCLTRQWVVSLNPRFSVSHTLNLFRSFAVHVLMICGWAPCHFVGFSERRAQKAAHAADARIKGGQPAAEDSLTSDDASAEDELDSDDGPANGSESYRAEEKLKLKAPIPTEPRLPPLSAKRHRLVDNADNRIGPPWPATSSDATTSGGPLRKIQPARVIRPKSKYEPDGVTTFEPGTSASKLSRRLILGLADLDSVHGRYVIRAFPFLGVLVVLFYRFCFKTRDYGLLIIPFFIL